MGPLIHFKACNKCRGDLSQEFDVLGWVMRCVQCGTWIFLDPKPLAVADAVYRVTERSKASRNRVDKTQYDSPSRIATDIFFALVEAGVKPTVIQGRCGISDSTLRSWSKGSATVAIRFQPILAKLAEEKKISLRVA